MHDTRHLKGKSIFVSKLDMDEVGTLKFTATLKVRSFW